MIRILMAALCAIWLGTGAAQAQATIFGDSDPVSFTGRTPGHHPVHGVDAARFQTGVNWATAQRSGVSFAFVKATEGGDMLDPMFAHHWNGARGAGIPTGAYHFYYFCTTPEVQARWFIRNVPRARGMLPPVLDMEWNPLSPTCQTRPEAAEVRRQMKVFLDILHRHYRQRPIVYTTPGFYRDNGLAHLREEFWLRTTAKTPAEAYPGQGWSFWQYSGTGLVPGFAQEVDLNVFAGNRRQWKAWLRKRVR